VTAPRVTVLIPARDEERWIAECLDAVAAQRYSHDCIEVIVVVDGESRDATDVIAKDMLERGDFVRTEVVRNPDGGTPGNLNAGLALATGQYVCRVDARSRIPAHYVGRCVDLLWTRPDVAVVGGAQVAVAARGGTVGAGIARALNNRWGMGLSRYRRGAESGAADTVYLGAFRTADLRAVDGWSRDFPTNQDFELNRRMAERGLVWFDACIPVEYVPRPDLGSLYRQYRRFGEWKVRYWRRTGDRPQPRQLALLVGVPAAGAVAAAAVATGSNRRRLAIFAAAAAAAAFVELRGSSRPKGGPAVHGAATAALAAVGAGWLRGAWGEHMTGKATTPTACPPRAVHLAPGHVPFDTRVFHKEARTLRAAGYDVAVVAPHETSEVVDGIEIIGLPRSRGRADRFLVGPIRLFRAARRARGDVYHVHDIEAVPVGVALSLAGKTVILDSHEDYPRLVLDRPWIPAAARAPMSRAVATGEGLAARAVDAVVSAEDAGAQRFPAFKTVVVRNAPLASEFSDAGSPIATRDNTVVYVGDITRQRGALEMVDAVGAVDAELDPRLVLVGRMGETGLEAELRARPGWPRVEYRGVQGREGVVDVLHASKVGLVLWHPTRKHREGAVPVKLLEYLAAGLPVVASDFPVLRGFLEPCAGGLLVDPLDVPSSAAAIEQLLRADPAELQAVSDRVRAYVLGNHTWTAESETLLDLYARLVGRP
jgi:glycosyltransferase involved in cell wall biosynthesis